MTAMSLEASTAPGVWEDDALNPTTDERPQMSKKGRKRSARKGNAANHGKRPNT